jgi:inosine/xanthosine triphosphate pyrophosphatase family protein
VDEVPFQTICDMVNGKSRKATARSAFGYYDGGILQFFEGILNGEIADKPT